VTGDMGDMFNAMREAKKAKRVANTVSSTDLLRNNGVHFTSHNAGVHLRIKVGQTYLDFWPSTGLWMVAGTKVKRRGILPLLVYIERIRKTL
jgi:hypothetical protein